jgi:hypothetical protein
VARAAHVKMALLLAADSWLLHEFGELELVTRCSAVAMSYDKWC